MLINLKQVSVEAQFHQGDVDAPLLVLSHPHPQYGGSMTNKVIDLIYRRGKDRSWSVFRYNTRGVGNTTGLFDQGKGETQDLLEIMDWVVEHARFQKLVLIGYSFGSWLTAQASEITQHPCMLIAPAVNWYSYPILKHPKQKWIFAAQNDEIVPESLVSNYASQISRPKSYFSIQGADHYFIGTTKKLVDSIFEQLAFHAAQ